MASEGEGADALDPEALPSDVPGLGALADELRSSPLTPMAAGSLATTIELLAGGDTETYVQTDRDGGVTRLAVLTDELTVRVLMLTASWGWKGPYVPDDVDEWITSRGYEPAPDVEVSEDA